MTRREMLVLFDLDDTLLDDASATNVAMSALHAELGSDESRAAFGTRWLASLGHHYARYIAGELTFLEQRRIRVREAVRAPLSDADADSLMAVYLAAYEEGWALFADTLPCLDALAAHKLAIVSNGNAEQQRQKLQRFGLAERFSCIVTSDEIGFGKPDARIFKAACQRCGVVESDALHVGDRFDLDVVGALNAGVHALWLDRRAGEASVHAGVTTIRSLHEVPMRVALLSAAHQREG